MTVTVRLDANTASSIEEVVSRVDRTAVWVASEAITSAARYMPEPVLAPYLGRRPSSHRMLLAFDVDMLDIIDGLAQRHKTSGKNAPSRHAIARAALLYLLDTHQGVDGTVAYLGESRPQRLDRRAG